MKGSQLCSEPGWGSLWNGIPYCVSGRGYKTGPVCMCVCVSVRLLVINLTDEPFDYRPKIWWRGWPWEYLRWLWRSMSYIKGQGRKVEKLTWFSDLQMDWIDLCRFTLCHMTSSDVTWHHMTSFKYWQEGHGAGGPGRQHSDVFILACRQLKFNSKHVD